MKFITQIKSRVWLVNVGKTKFIQCVTVSILFLKKDVILKIFLNPNHVLSIV